jgi:hypothetical protein
VSGNSDSKAARPCWANTVTATATTTPCPSTATPCVAATASRPSAAASSPQRPGWRVSRHGLYHHSCRPAAGSGHLAAAVRSATCATTCAITGLGNGTSYLVGVTVHITAGDSTSRPAAVKPTPAPTTSAPRPSPPPAMLTITGTPHRGLHCHRRRLAVGHGWDRPRAAWMSPAPPNRANPPVTGLASGAAWAPRSVTASDRPPARH